MNASLETKAESKCDSGYGMVYYITGGSITVKGS